MAGGPNADINAPDAWAVADGDQVILAVLDDAVEVTHEDLAGMIHSQWNAFDGTNDLSITDFDRHGTAVAGIAGALTGNPLGVKATAPKVKLMPVRVMRRIDELNVELQYTGVANAIEMAGTAGAHVISMSISLGKYNLESCDDQTPPSCQGDLESAIDALRDSTLLVFAAGNHGGASRFTGVVFPASSGQKHVECDRLSAQLTRTTRSKRLIRRATGVAIMAQRSVSLRRESIS